MEYERQQWNNYYATPQAGKRAQQTCQESPAQKN